MLRVVTGPFHPLLQSALVDRIRQCKAENALTPLIVLVPSSTLVRHLQRVLTIEAGLALLNVHIWTFHQFALRLRDERAHLLPDTEQTSTDRPAAAPLRFQPPRVVDPLFFEQAIRHLLQQAHVGFEPLRRVGHSSGTWGALWATIRDLNDAMVDGPVALRAVEEGYFGEEDRAWLAALYTLHGAVGTLGRSLQVGTPDDLATSLLPVIAESAWLQSPARVFYYGFYDLTQVQLSVLDAVARCADTTLFFPLSASGEGDSFARRFFERHLQPLIGTAAHWHILDKAAPPREAAIPADTTVYSVVGTEEELATACQLIREAVETRGYAWEDVGLVARSLEPYRQSLDEVFTRHRIPIHSTVTTPLIHYPLAKVLVQLAGLPSQDGYWATVLDLLSSPLFRHPGQTAGALHVRPDLWRTLVQTLGIVRGQADWSRLTRYGVDAPTIDRSERDVYERIPPTVAESLWHSVSDLLAACAAVPQQGTVGELLAAYRSLLARWITRLSPTEIPEGDDEDSALWQAIDQALNAVGELDPLIESLSWADFAELLTLSMERRSLSPDRGKSRGVHVLDAMAARGLPFKLLIVIGLNEQVFPRRIREDAFLRDRHRRVLDATLGFKIDEKLTGYDEEALLFEQLCRAASQQLVLLYQRANEEGGVLAPSPYLTQLTRTLDTGTMRINAVPRRLDERLRQRPHLLQTMPPRDLLQWRLLQDTAMPGSDDDRSALLRALGYDPAFYQQSTAVVRMLDDETADLTPYDGATGLLSLHWASVLQRGFSPTALQRYAQCPFRYFAVNVLRITDKQDRIERDIAPHVFGTLLHTTLRRVYEELIGSAWPTVPLPETARVRCSEDAVAHEAVQYEQHHARGYALMWQLTQEKVAALVAAILHSDEIEAQDAPFVLLRCEWAGEGTVAIPSEQAPSLKIHGTVDRIDRLADSHAVRIVDYKLKLGASLSGTDRDLIRAAVRAERLQPPLYSCFTLPEGERIDTVQFTFVGPAWQPPVETRTFSAAVWSQDAGRTLRAMLGTLVDGIHAGCFPIRPNNECERCAFRTACRKTHGPAAWRAARSETIQALRTISGATPGDAPEAAAGPDERA